MRLLASIIALLIVSLWNEVSGNAVLRADDPENNSWISRFTDWIIHWLKHHGKRIGKQCFEKRRKGIIPSAEKSDSPLTTFGYPDFNVKARQAIVRAETPLSFIGRTRQPVRIGSQDYVIAGYPDELLAFFACFENYNVIGSSLNDKGTWVRNTGTIKIQMQNLNTQGSTLSSSLFEMVFKVTLDRIIRYLNPVKVIKGLDCQILGGCDAASTLDKFKEAMAKIKEWLPASEKLVSRIIDIYKGNGTLADKAKSLMHFLKKEEERKAGIRKQWIGWNNVSHEDGRKILVTLTMYSKPEHRVRSTYEFARATLSMKDVGEAVKVALEKKKW